MRTPRRVTLIAMAGAFLMVFSVVTGAIAQPPVPVLVDQVKAWEMQAKSVAQEAGLTDEQTTKLTEAYAAARKGLSETVRALRQQEQPGGQREPGAMMEAMKTARTGFETAVKEFLDADQTTKVMGTLGTFSTRWDAMVTALDAMKLEEAVMSQAMKLVNGYVAESGKILQEAGSDFAAAREKTAPLREKLDAELAKILSEEQVTAWKAATAMRGRRAGGEGAGAGPGQALGQGLRQRQGQGQGGRRSEE